MTGGSTTALSTKWSMAETPDWQSGGKMREAESLQSGLTAKQGNFFVQLYHFPTKNKGRWS